MALFSERQNLLPKPILQTNSLDEKSRNMFYNLLDRSGLIEDSYNSRFVKESLWKDFFYQTKYATYTYNVFFDKWFYETSWNSILDLFEWLYRYYLRTSTVGIKRFKEEISSILVKNNIGYSFIDGNFIPITNETEIQSLQETMGNGFENVETHFNNAVQLFSDRENPDYTNCIKECICAVEAMLRIVLNTTDGTIGVLVKKIARQKKLSDPMGDVWSGMYGYVSDNSGFRHPLRPGEEINVDVHFAKYFLVISSAFINYLKGIK